MVAERHGDIPSPDSYVSTCNPCVSVRQHLWTKGNFPELRADDFCADDWIMGRIP